MSVKISKEHFGTIDRGRKVYLYTITNNQGMEVKISEFGATITSIKTPDRSGKIGEVVLGYDTLRPYLSKHPYIGSQIGRVASRIKDAKFQLGDMSYQLSKNEGSNQLHGGLKGFSWVLWEGKLIDDEVEGIELKYISPDGEEGFPGTLETRISFILSSDENSLDIIFNCVADKLTPVNLTRHEYFNLNIENNISALNHELYIRSKTITEIRDDMCSTGRVKNIINSAFDFNKSVEIQSQIKQLISESSDKNSFDINYIVDDAGTNLPVAGLYDQITGRKLDIFSDQPCLQFFSGAGLSNLKDRNGKMLRDGDAVCLEPQGFPDFTNNSFPRSFLNDKKTYVKRIRYNFSVM